MFSNLVNAFKDRTNRSRDSPPYKLSDGDHENQQSEDTHEDISRYESDADLPHIDDSDTSSQDGQSDAPPTSLPEQQDPRAYWNYMQCATFWCCPLPANLRGAVMILIKIED